MVLAATSCLTQHISLVPIRLRPKRSNSLLLAHRFIRTILNQNFYAHHIAHHSLSRTKPYNESICFGGAMISSIRETGTVISRRLKSSASNGQPIKDTDGKSFNDNNKSNNEESRDNEYDRAIQDLNLLQSNTLVLALAKYNTPETIIPQFIRQLELAGISLEQLDTLNVIHVSGTKGKGSTCAFAESILRAAGLKTGFYNSPHLIKVTERIKINGQPIEDKLFSKYFRQIFDRLVARTKSEDITMPSYFSFLTILAFHIFLEEKVDCAIIEVGIGGEYDPTNVIRKPVACGITTLDLDHTNILGNTIERIAWTKAGIIKHGSPVFTIQHEQSEALDTIQTRADERGSQFHICEPIQIKTNEFNLGIKGSVQYINAALACQLAKHFLSVKYPEKLGERSEVSNVPKDIPTEFSKLPNCFREGLVSCNWPGRCQIIEYPQMVFFIDGAHTKKSMENCLDWFHSTSSNMSENAYRVLMVNIIGERDRGEILKPLTRYEHFDSVIFSTNRINPAGDTSKSETFVNMQGPNSEKSLENVKFNANIWRQLMIDSCREGPNLVLKPNTLDSLRYVNELSLQNPDRKFHVLATGSLHFVGAILETLQLVNGLNPV